MAADHRHALPEGAKLEEFVVLRELGHGGFGITYLAKDTSLDAEVAIKEYLPSEIGIREAGLTVVPKSEGDRDDFQWGLERFLDEARTLAKFRHNNIVRVSRYFEANRTAYMVTEFERGRSLTDYLKDLGRRPTERELLDIVLPLLDGLEKVHSSGFLHRDIKPDNVYICDDGRPILLDFGAARQALGGKSKSLTSIVSQGYAPMEQYSMDSKRQGPWSDIYAMAAVLYRAIEGNVPIESTARTEAVLNEESDPLPALTGIARDAYSDSFLVSIEKALSVLPKDRPQTIGEWKGMLKGGDEPAIIPSSNVEAADFSAAKSQPVSDAPDDTPGLRPASAVNEGRKSPKGIAIAAVSGLAIAVGGAAFFFLQAPPSPPESIDAVKIAAPSRESAPLPRPDPSDHKREDVESTAHQKDSAKQGSAEVQGEGIQNGEASRPTPIQESAKLRANADQAEPVELRPSLPPKAERAEVKGIDRSGPSTLKPAPLTRPDTFNQKHESLRADVTPTKPSALKAETLAAKPEEVARIGVPAKEAELATLPVANVRKPYPVSDPRCDVSADNLSGRDLKNCILAGADLRGVDFRGASLENANLSSADLSGANLADVDLTGVNMTRAKLRNVILTGAKLERAILRSTDIVGANLNGVDLTKADFRSARVEKVSWVGANLDGTVLHDVVGLDCGGLATARNPGEADYNGCK